MDSKGEAQPVEVQLPEEDVEIDFVIEGASEAEIQYHLEARYAYMSHVLAMPQTQRLFASWDVYFGFADLVWTLRKMRAQRLRLAGTEKPRLWEHFKRSISLPVLTAFATAYAEQELRAPWLWVTSDLAQAYFFRLGALIMQEPIVICPDLIMLERLPAAKGRKRSEITHQTEWYFRHKVRGEAIERIRKYDIRGRRREAWEEHQWRRIKRDTKEVERLLGLAVIVERPARQDFA